MKALNLLKLLLLIQIVLGASLFAAENVVYRELSDREKQAMIDEYKRLLDDHKKQNGGVIDMAVVKPYVSEMVGDFYDQELISSEEVDKLKKRFETIENNTALSEQQKYDELIKLLSTTLTEVQKTPMQCMASTQACNQKSCCPGLVCAPEPVRKARGFRSKEKREGNAFVFNDGVRCKKDSDCESSKCLLPDENQFEEMSDDDEFALAGMSGNSELDKKVQAREKKKQEKRKRKLAAGVGRCEPVKRCYEPVKLGGSCLDNPVCASGKCLKVNFNTNFMGECRAAQKSCKQDSQCCSGSCENNRCVDQFLCKQCVQNGGKVKRGLKCCEGLIPNKRGRCIPDAPPMLLIKNNISPVLNFVLDLFIAKANAQSTEPKLDGLIILDALKNLTFDKVTSSITTPIPDEITNANHNNPTKEDGDNTLAFYEGLPDSDKEALDALVKADTGFTLAELSERKDLVTTKEADDEALTIIKDNIDDFDGTSIPSGPEVNPVDDKTGETAFNAQKSVYNTFEGSDFKNCKINFRNDYYKELQNNLMFEAEVALLGFEFVALGNGVKDYWKRDGMSIHEQYKKIATNLQANRREFNQDLEETNRILTCMCYDSKGFEFLDGASKDYFKNSCPDQYQAHLDFQKKLAKKEVADTATSKSIETGDASSIKYLRMMNAWADKMAELKARSLVRNQDSLNITVEANDYMVNQAPWDQTKVKDFELYRFTIKDLKSGAMLTGAAAGALLAAGAIAIAGGFATASTLSAWAATGIIAATSLAGAGGFWLLGALRGAWQAKTPTVNDSFVKGRESYKCGKKSQCSDFKRVLKQPYNEICNIHASSNACVKHFLVSKETPEDFAGTMKTHSTMHSASDVQAHFDDVMQMSEGESLYFIIDPWIPVGMNKSDILAGQPEYTALLEDGFKDALSYLKKGKPSGYQGSGYLSKNVIGARATAEYAPKLAAQNTYNLSKPEKDKIIAAAKKYAIDEQFFSASQTDYINTFANYVYKYHYLYPKAVPATEGNISYPPPGLATYTSIIKFGLFRITDTNGSEYRSLLDLQSQYRNLLADRLKLYRDNNQLGEEELKEINAEIEKLQGEVVSLNEFKGLATSLVGSDINTSSLGSGSNTFESLVGVGGLTSQGDAKGVVNSLRALGKLKEESKEEQEAYNKRMSGNEERKNTLLAAQKKMVDSFFNPLGTAKQSFFEGANDATGAKGSGNSSLNNNNVAAKLKNSGTNRNAFAPKNRNFGLGLGNNNSKFGSGSSSLDDGGLGLDVGASSLSGSDAESQGQISAAINARNNQPKGKYEPNDKDSLFDIVTKAYIRNYDKVLTKKKGNNQ
jgi:hypothetical protein